MPLVKRQLACPDWQGIVYFIILRGPGTDFCRYLCQGERNHRCGCQLRLVWSTCLHGKETRFHMLHTE